MGEFEDFLDHIFCQLSASGMHVDRRGLKDCLLVPGEGRRPLIQWALSQLDIKVKEEGNVLYFLPANCILMPFYYVLYTELIQMSFVVF
jgi:hypothetical protein